MYSLKEEIKTRNVNNNNTSNSASKNSNTKTNNNTKTKSATITKQSSNTNNTIDIFQTQFVNNQLLAINSLSTVELKRKYKELFKVNFNQFKRGFLIKFLSYKTQLLYGSSNTTEEEVNQLLKLAKQKQIKKQRRINRKVDNKNDQINQNNGTTNNTNNEIAFANKLNNKTTSINSNKINNNTLNEIPNINLLPIGSTITTYHKNQEYVVKILGNKKLSYNNKIYNSLTAIAFDITGTKWNGYTFFKLKKPKNEKRS